MNTNGDRIEWQRVKEIEEAGHVISISRLALAKPRYSFEVGLRNGPQKIGRHCPTNVNVHLGKAVVTSPLNLEVLARLHAEAVEWIRTAAQADVDESMERRIAYEQHQANRDKPKPQKGIKTLGKQDRAVKAAARVTAGG